MYIQRLAWAGVRIVAEPTVIVIDPLVSVTEVMALMGPPQQPLVPIREATAQAVLLTDLHPDHYDPDAIRACLARKGKVYCAKSMIGRLQRADLPVTGVDVYRPVIIGNTTITALPAADGLGDEQISWLVEADDRRLIHCGDTLYHGHWWRIAKHYGPFDVAFLPINGATIQFPGMAPSGLPVTMTPEQAANAGRLLQARAVCPINYGTFNSPPNYAEYPNAEHTFSTAAKQQGVIPLVIQPGNAFEWEEAAPGR